MRKFLFGIIVLLTYNFAFAQGEFEYTETSEDDSYFYMFLNQEDSASANRAYMPVIGLGRGIFTFFGDVSDAHRHVSIGRHGTKLNVSKQMNDFLILDYSIINGKITGNENGPDRNLNFQSEVLVGGVMAQYNFEHLFKKEEVVLEDAVKKTKIRPYIGLGIEAFEFNSKGDFKDADGNYYNYWSDGTIRNIPEDPSTVDQSIIIQRDYVYETDLREQNADGLGKYAQVAIAVPVEFGINVQVTRRVSFRTGMALHFALNDKVDNISKAGTGVRQGGKMTDNFMFTFVSLHLDLFSQPSIPEFMEHIDFLDISLFDFEDEDNDKIHDLVDDCAYTPAGIRVNIKGCPLDNDHDGIADDFDDELATAKGAIVDLKGVTMTEDVVLDTIAIPHDELCEWYPSLCMDSDVHSFKSFFVEIPEEWVPFDSNTDGYIDYEELKDVIDAWFDFKIEMTIDDVYRLNEFFFEQ